MGDVVDKRQYVTTDNTPKDSMLVSGADVLELIAVATLDSDDDSGSIYRIAEVPAGYVPVGGEITCEAISNVDDADLGLYETEENGGTVIDVNALVDDMDISSAKSPGSGLSPISNLSIDDQSNNLAEIAGDELGERQSYVLALTINADCNADGDVVVRLRLVRKELM